MSDAGLINGAHPTAPGGMSRKALADELVNEHGWKRSQVKPMMSLAEWPRLIDAVVNERRNAEASAERGQNAAVDAKVQSLREERPVPRDGTDDTERIEVDDDFADLGDEDEDDGIPGKGDGTSDLDLPEAPDNDMFASATSSTDDSDSALDPDALMSELLSIKDEQEAYEAEHGLLISDPRTYDFIFDGHAGAGPSGSERWMTCTASLQASREFLETLTPNQQKQFAVANISARQGTTAHAAAEVEARVILGEMDQTEADQTMLELAIMPETDGEAYDEEMAEYITEYVDLVKSYAQERGSENVEVEQRVSAAVPLTDLHEGEVYEILGSADFTALPTREYPTVVVGDLKYGNGIWVSVDENSQARIYGLGVLAKLADPETGALPDWVTDITYHIIQPRIDGIKTRTESIEDLLTWRDEVLAPALTAALYGTDEGATFVPTESGCQFCPARGGCAALAEDRMISAASLFDAQVEAEFENGPGSFPEPASLDSARLAELLAQITGLVSLHKDLKAEAERRLYRGEAVPGFQLVNYTPPREWVEGAADAFGEMPEFWVSKMMTPTQAIKLAQANKEEYDVASIEEWVHAPDKRPVVAREGDRRKTWEGRPPEAMFDVESDIENEED